MVYFKALLERLEVVLFKEDYQPNNNHYLAIYSENLIPILQQEL
jgi:hypothetical protein